MEGLLDELELTIGGRSFARGDAVMTLRNDRRLGVINGSHGMVEHVAVAEREIRVRLDDGRSVVLTTDYLNAGHVTHAYAITGHKAQGMTTDQAFVLGDDSLYREWGYVAMSRGREENRLYVVMGDGGRDEVGGAVDRPYEVDQLVRALERSRAKSLAFDPDADLRVLDRAALRAERDALYEQLSHAPPDRTRELMELREEGQRTFELLQRRRQQALEAERRLKEMGPIAKTRRKLEVNQLRGRLRTAPAVEGRLMTRLQEMEKQEKELVGAQKERDRWITEHAGILERAQRVETELGRRNAALIRSCEAELPKYLGNAVGPAPERPSERIEWRKSVLAIEDYRENYGVTDRDRALGGKPRNPEQRYEKERIERDIEEGNDRRHGRSRDDDLGLERSLELHQ